MDRHLLPHEYDLLLDGDSGFGLAPLRAHVQGCAACAAELDDARAVAAELDQLPHLAPSPLFTDRVMQQVQVFEPWHVALTDSLRALVPEARPLRVLAGVGGLAFATVLSAAVLWIVARVDLLALATGLSAERSRAALGDLAGSLAGALLGEGARGATVGVALLAGAVFLAMILAGVAGLRAAVARNGRSRG